MNGGYEEGYLRCGCFWGRTPGSLVLQLEHLCSEFTGLRVLDLGCGEGKNSVYLGERGARVHAIDISARAIRNAVTAWRCPSIAWGVADARDLNLRAESYDLLIAYGLLHCLASEAEVFALVGSMKLATKHGGLNIVVAFNDRAQDLSAHPGFRPCLIGHERYVEAYKGWNAIALSDSDLFETHPHNGVPHYHSMTRMLVQKP